MMGTVRPVTLRMNNAATEYCCPSDRGDDGRYFFIFQPAHLIEAQLPSQNEIWHHREVIPLFSIGKLHFIEWRGQCHRCIDHGNRIFKRIRWRVSHVSSGAIDSTSMTKNVAQAHSTSASYFLSISRKILCAINQIASQRIFMAIA
ncbi:hypothetical protein [Xanthomonas axonopodis]|uniref:hypothetical protein n=1 Tax=Xanthomonas axonopodis TaxID=53413 RepID=UPI001115BE7D|nr:hypothetical protein [Xanthomonas axonopodis]